MKKMMIIFVAVCCWSMNIVYAQADSTLRKTDASQANEPGVPKGYVAIRGEEVPALLQTTLQAPAYLGWEQGSIYQNRLNSQYLVVISNPGPETRRYFFDRNGNPITENEVKSKP